MLSFSSPVLGLLLSLLPNLAAAGQVIVKNNCAKPLYAWAVGGVHVHDAAVTEVSPSSVAYFPLQNIAGAGVSLKIKDVPHYEDGGKGIVQVEWTVYDNEAKYNYDISNVDCNWEVPGDCPFIDGGVSLTAGPSCRAVYCDTQVCHDVYQHWEKEPTTLAPNYPCGLDQDLVFQTCVAGAGAGGPHSKDESNSGKPDEEGGENFSHEDEGFSPAPEPTESGKADKSYNPASPWGWGGDQPIASSVPAAPSAPSAPSSPFAADDESSPSDAISNWRAKKRSHQGSASSQWKRMEWEG